MGRVLPSQLSGGGVSLPKQRRSRWETAVAKHLMVEIEALVQREVDRRMAALIGEMRPFSVKEAAERLGLALSTVYGLIREGKIETVTTGTNRVLIPAAEVDRLLSRSAA